MKESLQKNEKKVLYKILMTLYGRMLKLDGFENIKNKKNRLIKRKED